MPIPTFPDESILALSVSEEPVFKTRFLLAPTVKSAEVPPFAKISLLPFLDR